MPGSRTVQGKFAQEQTDARHGLMNNGLRFGYRGGIRT
jgi:hypothetical protein